ncbi:Bardet-Biedl syndrome 1 protein [Hyposmocoma kahamanoa]|uniref:Bardet-Biedl syndrome 1 protein n=1 Tax=Hyposmocoma kahamanoa TaxID=1477025 RepID=UPI000E6D927D|nr:Bardet-Biedl syndrome 1 protein [Hyposmocoma kahamanoa]
MQISDVVLPDLPLGVAGLYTSESRNSPILAVAFNSCVYMYRNMKMFYTYYLPAVEFNESEKEAWKWLSDSLNHTPEGIVASVQSLKATSPNILSLQSRQFLAMSTDQQLEYLEHNKDLSFRKVPEIACITTLKMHSIDRYSISSLVIGSEDGEVIILDPQTFTSISQAKVCIVKKTPHQMIATGLYNVDYRITIATREKSVCLLKREWPEGRILFNTDDHIIAIEVIPTDNSVMVICADHTLASYSKKGKKHWSLVLEHRPVSMTLMPIMHLGVTLVAVGLASGHVDLYDAKSRRDGLFVRDIASVMKFGQLGQEEHVFIIVTASGTLMLKILKRTAEFNAHAAGIELAAAANAQKPWLIPKKSKLFIEQSMREREHAITMHESFQHELNRLRLTAAKTLLEAHVKSDNFIGIGALEPVRLAAEVEGLGPVFRVTLIIENTSNDKAVIGLAILFHVHTANYKVSNPYIKVPLLAPGRKLKFPTRIEEVFEENINPDIFFRSVTGQGGERSMVKILLLKDGRDSPVLAATVQMPPTDPMMLPYDKMQATADFGNNDQFVQS